MVDSRRLPPWLKMQRASGDNYTLVKQLIDKNKVHTICTSGNCPNKGECWNAGTATLMILGDICTRSCKFCATKTGKPYPLDPEEPLRIADTVKVLGLKHAVITSVDRDDLPDGGSQHWAEVISAIKNSQSNVTIEVLIPDFKGVQKDILRIVDAKPDVISHNIETVRRLTPEVRSGAKYDTSLAVLKFIASHGIVTKSGIMLGLGELEHEVIETITDLYHAGCRVLTIGQYLSPGPNHLSVAEYIQPDKFEELRVIALNMGFSFVESSPLVRSSYHAEKHVEKTSFDKINLNLSELPTQKQPPFTFIDLGLMDYKEAWEYQERIFKMKVSEKGREHTKNASTPDHLLFVEHNHVYTLGKSGSKENLLLDYIQLQAKDAVFFQTDRGGDITYHGPGQLVGYPIFDLEKLGIGVKEYIHKLEESIIRCLSRYGIITERLKGATGVWIDTSLPHKTRKICAIGVKVNRSITMHGFALNIHTDLSYFNHINPCGYTDKGVTSLVKEIGTPITLNEVKLVLLEELSQLFHPEQT